MTRLTKVISIFHLYVRLITGEIYIYTSKHDHICFFFYKNGWVVSNFSDKPSRLD